MFVALGVGEAGVGAAMCPPLHARLLQSAALPRFGSVIHATGQQDVSELGGLRSQDADHQCHLRDRRPIDGRYGPTGGLLVAKDEILVKANDFNIGVLILILITLPITAMYTWRVYALTFLGKPKDETRT